jgi:hypothetical protein
MYFFQRARFALANLRSEMFKTVTFGSRNYCELISVDKIALSLYKNRRSDVYQTQSIVSTSDLPLHFQSQLLYNHYSIVSTVLLP